MGKNFKIITALFMVSVMMLVGIPAVSFAAGENENTISVEDHYIYKAGTKGTAEGYLHDITVSGAAVSIYTCREDVVLNSNKKVNAGEDIPVKIYHIELDPKSTPQNASFTLIFNTECTKTVAITSTRTAAIPDTISTFAPPNYTQIAQDAADNDIIHRGYLVTLTNGVAEITLYGYGYMTGTGVGEMFQYNFDFSIGKENATDDPDISDVKSLTITKKPDKTAYRTGESFDTVGMEVTATLKDDSTKKVTGYTYVPNTALKLSDTVITISYGEYTAELPITVVSSAVISGADVKNGQFLDANSINKDKKADAVILFGEEKGRIEISVGPGLEVYAGGVAKTVKDGKCELLLDSSVSGTTTEVTIQRDSESNKYEFTCFSQACDGLPTSVMDYLCIASQYTNGWWPTGATFFPYGLNGVSTLRGVDLNETTSSTVQHGPTSLGYFGGYIVYYYKDAITDNPNNPYGVDFIVYGNSYDGTAGFAEPGNVLVSENGTDWYPLAGSVHYENNTIWNYSMTYTKTDSGSDCVGSDGSSGTADKYPLKSNYPLYAWTSEKESKMTLTGTLLGPQEESSEYGNTVPVFPDFGYADCGVRTATNAAVNPYTGISVTAGSSYVNNKSDGFDLAWAVDANGKPVTFSGGIHYIKVQTATSIFNAGIGEKSTEVNGVRVAAATPTSVGLTSAPVITIDGVNLKLQNGVNCYDAAVVGSFDVNVSADSNANVYINGARGASRSYETVPDKGMLRIITQNGTAAPVIYYIDLTADTGVSIPAITANLNSETSYVKGDSAKELSVTAEAADGKQLTYQWYVSSTSKTSNFSPIPGANSSSYTPDTGTSGTRYYFVKVTVVKDGPVADINSKVATVTVSNPPSSGTITVYFTLLGDTLHGNGGTVHTYKKTRDQLQTWISHKAYTVPSGSKVIDVFAKALTEENISWKNEKKINGTTGNYIQSITYQGFTLEEIANGPLSGWMYLLNAKHPDFGVAEQSLKDGDQIIFHWTDDYTQEEGAERMGPKPGEPATNGTTVTFSVRAMTDASGKASASVSAKDISSALSDARKAAKTAEESGKKDVASEVKLDVKADSKATSVETAIPTSSMKEVAKADNTALTVATPVGNVSFDQKALSSISSVAAGSDISVGVGKVEPSKLSEAQKAALGDRPVYELNLISGGQAITDFNGGKVSISLPYTLKAGETPDNICIFYVDGNGGLTRIDRAKYDEKTGMVTFTTGHFSYYAIGYQAVEKFADVKSDSWFYNAAMLLVNKGVIKGKGDNLFAPNDNITRAEFVQILYSIAQTEADTTRNAIVSGAAAKTGSTKLVFQDLKASAWYAEAVAWAYENGVTAGVAGNDGNLYFAPNANISRQDMAVMIQNFADKVEKKRIEAAVPVVGFTDESDIAAYAKEAVSRMQQGGIINGTRKKNASGDVVSVFSPKDSATRAEAATMIANLLKQ